MNWTTRAASVGVLAGTLLLATAWPAAAHPLGNFTVNRYDGIVVSADSIQILHVVDFAEIPTLQQQETIDVNNDQVLSDVELSTFADGRCLDVIGAIDLTVGAAHVPLDRVSASARVGQGQAGLPVLRLECSLRAHPLLPHQTAELSFVDDSDVADIGWREVTVAGDGVTVVSSDVPATSVSAELTRYPTDLLSSPLRVDSATASVRLGGATLTSSGNLSSATQSVAGPLGFGAQLLTSASSSATGTTAMVLALVVALVVGAAHALAPGHGKTIVAFALAGRRERSMRAAVTVGATVTLTHTASVLLLGLVIATASSLAPASLYPWLAAASGVVVFGLGLTLLRSAAGSRGHSHDHGYPHGHDHPHTHGHSHAHAHPQAGQAVDHRRGVVTADGTTLVATTVDSRASGVTLPEQRRGTLWAVGAVGGLVPSPTAVVVLLGTAATGRAWFGVLLVLFFGLGMAATLAGIGALVIATQTRVLALTEHTSHPVLQRGLGLLPVATALVVTVVGLLLVLRPLLQL